MTGFKNFVLRGNLVELAVAFVMGTAFARVVTATVDLIMGIIGKIGDQPDFNAWTPGGLLVGAWLTAVISFVILAAVVYFLIVKPYTVAKEKFFPAEDSRHAGRRRAARGDPRPAGQPRGRPPA